MLVWSLAVTLALMVPVLLLLLRESLGILSTTLVLRSLLLPYSACGVQSPPEHDPFVKLLLLVLAFVVIASLQNTAGCDAEVAWELCVEVEADTAFNDGVPGLPWLSTSALSSEIDVRLDEPFLKLLLCFTLVLLPLELPTSVSLLTLALAACIVIGMKRSSGTSERTYHDERWGISASSRHWL